ncbi:o-succinylbenzoate--CoA ligase [Nakamurella endophytica]|uniref:O-succinylbenzoic acid--CoA ligase MenE n=1 Tax=Nakamurella endophytica TaxID=1748367 RepID=A0A917SYN0_9ACTN|nr:o-succinylbenzoate--CoA ligase [Nakamurella endophytica]GGM03945.1 putative O-succinylbenzoic acid--CoA ligase MenE [Nakamurella endophytica]
MPAASRTVELLPVPTGRAVLDLLPVLARAAAGEGPALLPVPAGGDATGVAGLGPGEPLGPREDDDADPTALVVATSGSTGAPKGTLLPVSALAASADATQRRLGTAGSWLLALPAQHVAGLQVLLRAARSGAQPVVLDTAAPFTARAFLAAVGRMPAGRGFVSLVPTQLRRVLADGEATAALAGFAAVLVGGAATPPALVAAARAAGVAVVTTYGMSETCGGCVYDGHPLDRVEVAVEPVDGSAAASPGGAPDGTGRVVLSGPVVARGYRGRPGDPAFPPSGAGGARTGHRRFRTADLGRIGPDGVLEVLGRTDDVVVSGGVNVHPQAVEAVLAALPGVAEVVVVGVPDPEWGQRVAAAVVPATGHPDPELPELRTAVRTRLGPAAAPSLLRVLARVPVLPSGKPDRRAIAGLFGPVPPA